MHNDPSSFSMNSDGWNFFVRACFGISLVAMALAIVFMPVTIWIKGFLAMSTLMVVTSSIMLSKALRDEFESRKLLNRISEARTEKILKEIDV